MQIHLMYPVTVSHEYSTFVLRESQILLLQAMNSTGTFHIISADVLQVSAAFGCIYTK